MNKAKIILSSLIIFFIFNITIVSANNGSPIIIDGYYDDWADKPLSYHYDWDNSENCWYWGEWADTDGDGVYEKYLTPENTYDNNVRHIIQLFSDSENLYVHIKIARIYVPLFNGEWYNFIFNNGHKASFEITDRNGQYLTGNIKKLSPGIHNVQVRHADSFCTYEIVENSEAYLTVYDDYLYTELEFKVPLESCVYQNPKIDLNNLEVIKFFTPNLMYYVIESHGTPTFSVLLIVICIIIVIASQLKFINKRRKL